MKGIKMLPLLKKRSLKKSDFIAERTSEFEDITATENYNVAGCYINDKEIETRVECYIYKNGNTLSKIYLNNHLRMIKMAKA